LDQFLSGTGRINEEEELKKENDKTNNKRDFIRNLM